MEEAKTAEQIVRASVEAYNRHDLDGCIAFLAPGATWELVGMGGPPLTPEELRILFWQYILRDVRIEIRGLTAMGDCVAAEYIQSYLDDDQQRRLSAPLAIFYEVRDGLIARARAYFHPSWDRAQE
jgi:ketosteroid isomerase-like protein